MAIQLGVGIQDGSGGVMAGTLDFEALVGRQVDATRHYRGFNDNLNGSAVRESIAGGRSPLIAWHAFEGDGTTYKWSDISAGRYDDIIALRAQELISLGNVPIKLCLHHEPEDDVTGSLTGQGDCGAPEDYAPYWHYVHAALRSHGVGKNVKIGVCLMGRSYHNGQAEVFIPPDIKPDWLASDGYNHGGIGGGGWRSFTSIFQPAYFFASARGKRLTIEECGTVEGAPGQKAAWFEEAATMLQAWDVPFYMYSHVVAHKPYGDLDYRVDTSPDSLAAFKSLVTSSG